MSYTAREMTLPEDHRVRCVARQGRVRALALRAEQTIEEMRRLHDLSPLATLAAGRLAMGAQLLAAELKHPEASLSMILRPEGALGNITVVADSQARVRVTLQNPQAENMDGSLALSAAVGKGSLTVIKDLGLKEPYGGTVPLVSGEIAEDLAAYCLQSEQVPSVLALGLSLKPEGVLCAGGLLVQLLPSATEEDLDYIEARARGGFPDLSFLLQEGMSPAQILDLFLGDPEMEYLETQKLSYFCPCNRTRMSRNLLTLGKTELLDLAQDPRGIELTCHFCNHQYKYEQKEIQCLVEELGL